MNKLSFTVFLSAALGGAIGASGRLLVSFILRGSSFPVATFAVNLTGCYLIGLVSEILLQYYPDSQNMKIFFITGMLGAFTTFSAFAFEGVELYSQSRYLHFITLTSLQVIAGLFLVVAGRQSVVLIAN